jgi:hypothetical protein
MSGAGGKTGSRPHQAVLLLQLDAASFGSGRAAESLVRRIIERERRLGHELAERLSATIRQEYVELGSGREIMNSEVIIDMLTNRDLETRRIDYVIAPDLVPVIDSLDDLRLLYDAIYESGAMLIPFRLDLDSDSQDPDDQRLLRDLSTFYARQGRPTEPGDMGGDL